MVGLAFCAWLVIDQFSLSGVVPATPETTEFSAQRAMPHLDVIAAAPWPAGSPGHDRTRAYLLAELRKMGLEPQIQETTSVLRFPRSPGFSAGLIKNVLVRVPGTASTGAIALDAHYDGAATGPAAADCGSGVIVLLETLRAILAGPPLKNDLIFVFADAEEVGDLGAHAFAAHHPWMRDVRVALNYEAMGTSGPAYLYATNNGRQLRLDDYQLAKQGRLRFNYAACPPQGVELLLTIAGTNSLEAALIDMAVGLPQLPGEPERLRPETTMPSPLGADSTVVRNEIEL